MAEARLATPGGGSLSAGRGGGEQAAQESARSPGAGGAAGASPVDGAPGRTCARQAAGPALPLPAAATPHWDTGKPPAH